MEYLKAKNILDFFHHWKQFFPCHVFPSGCLLEILLIFFFYKTSVLWEKLSKTSELPDE